jgi:vacuolar-type H+-ATPase subunit I/STV1
MPTLDKRLEVAREVKEIEITRLEKIRRGESVLKVTAQMREVAKAKISQSRKLHPVLAARDAAKQRLARVKARRVRLEADVNEMLEGTGWWTQLTYGYPDYKKMDKEIQDLEREVSYFLSRNAKIIREAEEKLDAAAGRIDTRLQLIEESVISAIPDRRQDSFDGHRIARDALILSALSVPVSAWQDISQAGEVYDALRLVNGNFEGMSDSEVWFQTLAKEPESLAGLISLTKGALF